MGHRLARVALLAAGLAVVAACGCSDLPSRPSPVLQAVDPPTGIAGLRTPVVLRGTGFRYPLVTSVSGGAASGDLAVTLGGVPLEDVVLHSETEIAATVPATLPVGVHDAAVVFPDDRAATLAGAYTAEPPVAVTLEATPPDLARGEHGTVTITFTSRVDAEVALAFDEATTSPVGALALEAPDVPAVIAPNASIAVEDGVTAVAPDDFTGTEVGVHVQVRWTLGDVTGPSAGDTTVALLPPTLLDVTLDAPAEIELGDSRAVAATVTAGAVGLAELDVTVTPSSGIGLQPPISLVGATLAAGASTTLPATLAGLAVGPASLTLDASATAQRGDPPAPLHVEHPVTVRAGPLLVIEPPTLPDPLEAGAPFTLGVTARNDGDVAATGGVLTVGATAGDVAPASLSFDLQPGTATTLSFQATATTAGAPATFDLDATATSALSGRSVSAAHVAVTTVPPLAAAALSLWATPADPVAVVGQSSTLLVALANPGGVDVHDATVTVDAGTGVVLVDGSGTEVPTLVLGPVTVAAGGTFSANLPLRATVIGTSAITLSASGTDALTGAAVTATAGASVQVRGPQPPVVQIVRPPATGLTAAPGSAVQVLVGALADPGHTVTSITLGVSGPATVAAPATVAVAARGTGASFTVNVAGGAADGAAITLTATAADDLAQIGVSSPSVVTVAAVATLARVDCEPASLLLRSGLNGEVFLVATSSDGTRRDVTSAAAWQTSDATVVTVTGGITVPVGAGTATVTGSYGGLSADCDATVVADGVYNVPARLAVAPGGSTQVRCYALGSPQPADITAAAGTTWTTADPSVVTVSATGVVTGVGSGLTRVTACSSGGCATTDVLSGADVELPGALGPGPIGMGGAQAFESLLIRAGVTVQVVGAPLELSVTDAFVLESGASVVADGGDAPSVSMTAPTLPLRAQGGDGAPGGGGGGAGSGGNASNLCGSGNDNCGGTGDPAGANACKNTSCGGGNGGGPGGGGGSPPTVGDQAGDAGGGGGHGGAGGRGGRIVAGQWAGSAGAMPGQTSLGGGSGGGGGDGSTGNSGSGGGGGGAGGVIRIAATGATTIRIDGVLTARGGRGGSLRAGAKSGPGGGAAGGLVEITAPAGTVGGAGRIVVTGGAGGYAGGSSGPCGGGGGGGGGRVLLAAPVAAPFLLLDAGGAPGGDPCAGGQPGEAGAGGLLSR